MGNIHHHFFTRQGGVSEGLYASLNVGIGSADNPQHVLENRARVAAHFGLRHEHLATVQQIHSAEVVTLSAVPALESRPRADAMVTNMPNIILGILTADCAPVLFADEAAGVIGAAHAGWKGARLGVLKNTIAAMEALGASRGNIIAQIGPCIAQQSYEVGPEFRERLLVEDEENDRFFYESPVPSPQSPVALTAHRYPFAQTKRNARVLRKQMTDAEMLLWQHLKRRQLGVKFRKQHPLGSFILDFICVEVGLVIELDGGQHADEKVKIYDEKRSQWLSQQGLHVLRFWNHEVLNNIDGVLQMIIQALQSPSPVGLTSLQFISAGREPPETPSPIGGGLGRGLKDTWAFPNAPLPTSPLRGEERIARARISATLDHKKTECRRVSNRGEGDAGDSPLHPNKFLFNLPAYVQHKLMRAGIRNIAASDADTCLDEKNYFSYRRATLRNELDYGRQISCVVMR